MADNERPPEREDAGREHEDWEPWSTGHEEPSGEADEATAGVGRPDFAPPEVPRDPRTMWEAAPGWVGPSDPGTPGGSPEFSAPGGTAEMPAPDAGGTGAGLPWEAVPPHGDPVGEDPAEPAAAGSAAAGAGQGGEAPWHYGPPGPGPESPETPGAYPAPSLQASAHHGPGHQGSEYQGSEYQGSAYPGPAHPGFAYQGSAYQGSVYQGQPPPAGPGGAPVWPPPPPASSAGTGQGERRGPGIGGFLALALIIALVAGSIGAIGTYLLTGSGPSTDPGYSLDQERPSGNRERPPESIAGVARRVLPSVVSIKVGSGSGSGFLIKDGFIVTNNHVVAEAGDSELQVRFNDGKTTTAEVVGKPAAYADLAVLKPEETFGAPELKIGNSDDLVVGDAVTAVGSPLGLPGTVTTGIVSALNRPVVAGKATGERSYIDAVQTDAAINPGNSGGPLVNTKGELVGVNSVIASLGSGGLPGQEQQSGSIGLGFAIPANQTKSVVELIITKGEARRPILGVLIDERFDGPGGRIAAESAPDGTKPVGKDSPAEDAGLQPADIITKINGKPVQNFEALQVMLANFKPGDTVKLTYQRGGKEKDTEVKLEAE